MRTKEFSWRRELWLQCRELLYGEPEGIESGGVCVYAEGGKVYEVTCADVVTLPDTPKNRADLVADAKATVEAWRR